jgi:adenosine 3'-phospho 5'-phosphosulfate transporter B3
VVDRSFADLPVHASSAGFTATQEGVFRGADFHYGGMVTLFTTLVYCAAAAIERKKSNDAVRKGSWRNYLILAAITTGSMWITNAAMQYLNYTTRIVAKSSKVIPTMILGTFMQGRTYGRDEYGCAVLLVCGNALFTMGGETTSHTLACE